jgi:2-polyprenyl-3-methyl-5-hydroxy-6-metoxy-1,4-benzoquinol methylase
LTYAAFPPSDEALAAIYAEAYLSFGLHDKDQTTALFAMKRRTFDRRLNLIQRISQGKRILDVGCASGAFLVSARERGWKVQGIEQSPVAAAYAARISGAPVFTGTLDTFVTGDHRYDVVHMADVIEHLREPRHALLRVRDLLAPQGVLVLTTPDVDSLSARILGRNWPNYKPEHLFYPNRRTIQELLMRAGFRVMHIRSAVKALTIEFAEAYFRVYGPTAAWSALAGFSRFAPQTLRRRPWYFSAGDMLVVAQPAP